MDETDLIARIRKGDKAAGVQLVSELAPTFYRHAARLADGRLSETDAEIAAETAVEKAVAGIAGHDPAKGDFRGWVFGILRRCVYDALSARRGVESLEVFEETYGEIPDNRPDRLPGPRPRMAPDLTPVLLTLPVEDQAFLLLRHDTHLTWADIADVLGGGATADACRKRHSRIVKALRAVLDPPADARPTPPPPIP